MFRKPKEKLLQAGDVIWQYQIDEYLGSGAFGSVYLAHHRVMTRRLVAMKQLRTSQTSPVTVKRFIHESYAMGELNHPNVVLIYELIEPEQYPNIDNYYIVMEYLDGGTLDKWMEDTGRPEASLGDVIRIIKEVCLGLSAAHHENIFHRDIKPENILLSLDSKKVKIGDWGLAHIEEHQMTQVGVVMGTMDYMSPEQASGHSAEVDARSDMYSVGVILYQILTGNLPLDLEHISNDAMMRVLEQNPLEAGNMPLLNQVRRDACLKAICSAPRQNPRYFVPDLAEPVVRLVMKAIAIEPKNRFQTAEDFISALDQLAAQVKAKPSTKSDENTAMAATLLVQARQHRQDRNYTEALQMLEKARTYVEDDTGVCLELARIYNLMARPADALKVLLRAYQHDPDNYVVLRDLGITYMAVKDRDRACDMLQRSLTLNPNQSKVVPILKSLQRCK